MPPGFPTVSSGLPMELGGAVELVSAAVVPVDWAVLGEAGAGLALPASVELGSWTWTFAICAWTFGKRNLDLR